MLRISKLADYATMIMNELAQSDTLTSASMISHHLKMSKTTVSKLLKCLAKSGLVTSERGTHGGYRLARPPEAIKLSDVVIAIDGETALTDCAIDKHCPKRAHCSMEDSWRLINLAITRFLSQFTLYDMKHNLKEHPLIQQWGVES